MRGLLIRSEMAEVGALVAGLDAGRAVVADPDPDEASGRVDSRVLESQQTAPRSHKLAGSLMTTDG